MNQDWEWEDLLTEQEKAKREAGRNGRKKPVKKSGSAPGKTRPKTGVKKKTNAGEESRRRSNLIADPAGRKPDASGEADGKEEKHPGEDSHGNGTKPDGEAVSGNGTGSRRETEPGKQATESAGKKQASDSPKPASGKKRTASAAKGKKKKRKKGRRARKKKSVFPWIYLALVVILAVSGAVIVRGVYKTMEELRDNTPETYIRRSIDSLTDQDLTMLFASNPAYETPGEAAANIRAFLSGEELSFRRVRHNEYDVMKQDRHLFSVVLNASRSVNKLGLLNYDILESAGITPVADSELFHYEIIAPSSSEITINGKPVGEPVSKEVIDGFADAAGLVELPSVNTYVIDNLTKEPEIKVTDNGRDVPVTLSERIDLNEAAGTGISFASTQEAGIDFDAMAFAKDWAMFMRDDLGGEAHGYYKLEPFFIADTALQKKAYEWASNVDITFTSTHTLMDPPFTDEQVSDIVKYDDNTARVNVSLKMHMVLDRGQERTDVIDTTLYLVRRDGDWKVVNIRDDSSSGEDGE